MASDRHHGVDVVRGYLEGSAPGALSVSGEPTVLLMIDPAPGTIGISTPAGGEEPDLIAYRLIDYKVILEGDRANSVLTVKVPSGALDETYAWLCAVIDRIQIDGLLPGQAIGVSLTALDDLLETSSVLSIERQVGLFGELVFLSSLIDHAGPAIGIGSWFGSDSEEHDFRLTETDIEVKTTTAEKRRHWISTETQLAPLGDRPLCLHSIQVTPTPADVGWSLPELVAHIADRLERGAQRDDFAVGLNGAGYRLSHEPRYDRRWALRTDPLTFPVDDHFPAIRSGDIATIIDEPVRVVDFKYQLQLDGLPTQELGFQIHLPAQESP